ncbi:MAG TPA: GNAT family N-acetyltransferase [Anaerolineae bacterium]|nr:GNAT family N-acetyltransferase [Anaerolineae bacterium]
MNVELCHNLESLVSLQPEWDTLLQRSATNVIFLTWAWQRAWWNAFGSGKDLRVLALRDGNGHLEAIVSLFVQETPPAPSSPLPDLNGERPLDTPAGTRQRTVYLIGGTEVSDYLDVIAPAVLTPEVCATFLDVLASMNDWHVLDLRPLPAGSPTVSAVVESCRARGWDVHQTTEDVCPVFALPHTWAEYLSQRLNKKQRHELRRKIHRAEQRTAVEWHWVDNPDTLSEGLDIFFRLHKASDPGKDVFMDDQMLGFFSEVAQVALEKGWLRLSLLRFDGHPVASYLCFDYRNDRLVYNSGFDPSAYRDLSPGIVLLGYLIKDAIQSGCRSFDFLRGDERYKYSFGAKDTEVLRLVVRR